MPPNVENPVHRALSLWRKDATAGSPLAHLRIVQQALAGGAADLRQATNQVLHDALDALEAEMPTHAYLLREHFVKGRPIFAVANEMNISEGVFYKWQRKAIERLTAIVEHRERAAAADLAMSLALRLPAPPYTYLIGVEPHLERLGAVLRTKDAPRLVAIQGIGGIGKTSLAYRLAVQLVLEERTFAEVAWVSAQQQSFHLAGLIREVPEPALNAADLVEALARQLLPADAVPTPFLPDRALPLLQARLATAPSLVVVDNLETLPDVDALLPILRRLAGPSRFLITSRYALSHEPDVYAFTVPELGEADALRLLRREAEVRNLPDLLGASDEDLRAIYDTVGGNPLALKLVAGQLFLLPLPQVLEALRSARGRRAEALYRYIYWTAWRQLGPDEREVLLTMPLFGQTGADLRSIARACDVQGPRLEAALERLTRLSLVNVNGDLQARRYSIHRLTETWLLQDVVGWENAPQEEL
ncbi:MAG: NB-ARC domain-containing protein [Anaerolineae bacterium]|nr:NB-ARC domain-containing protein [Anaerolineae bacterium]